jgi:hypothetical protein
MSNEVNVTITADEKKAVNSINNLNKSVDGFAKNSQSSFKRIDVAIGSFAGSLASGAVLGAVKFIGSAISSIFSSAIAGANQQEAALNKLSNSLRITGEFSRATLKDFESFASGIQNVTKFGDELVLNQLAIAKTFGATNDQAKLVVRTAADLATALGTSLDSAVEQLSGTLNGSIGRLGKVVPELKSLTEEQLRAGEGLRILSERFNGFAQRDAASFGGATAKLKNAVGDLGEEFGFLITKNEDVKFLLGVITSGIESLSNAVKSAAPAFSATTNAIATLFGKINDAEQARSNIAALDIEINRLKQSLQVDPEKEGSFLAKIFGGPDKSVEVEIERLLTQKKFLEDSITQIEKEAQEQRKANADGATNGVVQRAQLTSRQLLAVAYKRAEDEEKLEKAKRENQRQTLSSTASVIGSLGTLFEDGSRKQKTLAISQATIDTYVAANKNLALGGPLGFAAAASAIATGLANVARITNAGKFANGGFVGGSSYKGDRVTASVNSGEAILNPAQQRNFMELANNGSAANSATFEILSELRNLKDAIMSQPVVMEVSGREIARVVRDERAAGFAI